MITDIILYLLGAFVGLISSAFGLISYAIPSEIEQSIAYFFSYLNYVAYIFPIDTIFQAIGTLLLFFTAKYSIQIVTWIYSIIPIFGSSSAKNMPRSDMKMTMGTYEKGLFGQYRYKKNQGRTL